MSHVGNIKQYEVVQLDPTKVGNPMFAGCLMVVSEVKAWGAQGYVQSLGSDGKPGGQAYYRAKWEEMVKLEDGVPPYVIE